MAPRWLQAVARQMNIRRKKHPDLGTRLAESETAVKQAHASAAVARKTLEQNNLALIVNTALGISPRERSGEG